MIKVLAVTGREKYKTVIKNKTHTLIVDEPTNLGGEDLGFAPDELLAASLASCTSITLRMYADRKEWELEEIQVEVGIEKDTETNGATFQREISLKGKLDESQVKRLNAIANACPVHKLLTNQIKVETKINI